MSELKATLLPCGSCPWRVDQGPESIPGYSYDKARALTSTVGLDDGFRPIMACHGCDARHPRACRGYLARHGWQNLNVRRLLSAGRIANPSKVLDAITKAGIAIHRDYGQVLDKLILRGEQ